MMHYVKQLLILLVLFSVLHTKGQSHVNIVLGRFSGEVTYLNNSVIYASCSSAYMDFIPDGLYANCVREQDSCFTPFQCASWCSDPWSILVNADSTLIGYAPWTAAAAASGRLYANDSIYLKVKTFGTSTTWREFRGFKLYSTVGLPNQKMEESGVQLGPNPCTQLLIIQMNGMLLKNNPLVYAIDGTAVEVEISKEPDTYKLDVSSLPSGFYFVSLHANSGMIRKKLLVQH